MNNPRRSVKPAAPAMPQGEVLETFDDYGKAVAYVDRLIEAEFPAGLIAIVGKNLRSVERIRTRIGQGRVALSGAITGSWIGLFFSIFTASGSGTATTTALGMSPSILIGAGLGMLLNVLRYSFNRNRRHFASQSMIIASEYQVQVPSHLIDTARQAAAKTPAGE